MLPWRVIRGLLQTFAALFPAPEAVPAFGLFGLPAGFIK
jgi:hypothetical protein